MDSVHLSGRPRPPTSVNLRFMWELRGGRAMRRRIGTVTAIIARSAALEGGEAFDFPFAVVGAAGLALQPGFGSGVHVARQEIAAGKAAFVIGGREWRDVAAGAGMRILPRHAGILAAARQRFGGDRARIGEVDLRRLA